MNQLSKQVDFAPEVVAIIKQQIAPKATDSELQLFLYQCKRTGLDPLLRQIYAIHRWNSMQGKETMTIQTSIDGFRVIAERSGDYAGQDEPVYIEQDGRLVACKVTIYRFRGEQRYPAATGVAYWSEYVQTGKEGKPMGLWAKMPRVMIAKVAEAIALRKSYPQDLSGLYTNDEISDTVDAKPQNVQIIDLDAQNKAISDAVGNLSNLHTIAELSAYKASLSKDVVNSTQFKEHGMKRYQEIIGYKKEEGDVKELPTTAIEMAKDDIEKAKRKRNKVNDKPILEEDSSDYQRCHAQLHMGMIDMDDVEKEYNVSEKVKKALLKP